MALDDRELGSRIAYWRERRGITQRLLADRIGRSKSWIEKAESGVRSANRLPILLSICKELRIDLPVLIGREPARDTPECIDEIQVEAIRASLERYDSIGNTIPDDYRPDSAKTWRQISYVWSAFEMADYQVVSRTLPELLLDAQRSHAILGNTETACSLTEVYQITVSALLKLGEYDLAWLAGDRGMHVSEQTENTIMPALTGCRVASALVAIGRPDAAFQLNISLASRIESGSTEAEMSAYGHLLLSAAMAAAHKGDAISVRDLIREARSIADHVPDGANHYRLSFGPANVGVHHVSDLVSLGEGGLAVEAAEKVSGAGIRLLRRERRASHLIDVARGYSQWGMREEALNKLLEAETVASSEVNCRPLARSTIENLMERSAGKPSTALRSLAERARIAP
jgi:transcriptional regulator with XRE-family HTH domain